MKKVIITDDRANELFNGWNFGEITPEQKRMMIAMCVFKRMSGFADSRSMQCIARDAGCLTAAFNPTRQGKYWAFRKIEEHLRLAEHIR